MSSVGEDLEELSPELGLQWSLRIHSWRTSGWKQQQKAKVMSENEFSSEHEDSDETKHYLLTELEGGGR